MQLSRVTRIGRVESFTEGGRIVGHHSKVFIGIDASKNSNAVAIAEAGRDGEVCYLGAFDTGEAATRKWIARPAARHGKLTIC